MPTAAKLIRISKKTDELIAQQAYFGETYDAALQRILSQNKSQKDVKLAPGKASELTCQPV